MSVPRKGMQDSLIGKNCNFSCRVSNTYFPRNSTSISARNRENRRREWNNAKTMTKANQQLFMVYLYIYISICETEVE